MVGFTQYERKVLAINAIEIALLLLSALIMNKGEHFPVLDQKVSNFMAAECRAIGRVIDFARV